MRISDLYEWRVVPPPKSKWTPMKILKSILGNRVTDNDARTKEDSYVVSRPWTNTNSTGMFSTMDQPTGGAIGIPNPQSSAIQDLVVAIHEGYHAYLHMTGKDYNDENAVNDLSEAWIMKNMSGIEQKKALQYLQVSRDSHGHI